VAANCGSTFSAVASASNASAHREREEALATRDAEIGRLHQELSQVDESAARLEAQLREAQATASEVPALRQELAEADRVREDAERLQAELANARAQEEESAEEARRLRSTLRAVRRALEQTAEIDGDAPPPEEPMRGDDARHGPHEPHGKRGPLRWMTR